MRNRNYYEKIENYLYDIFYKPYDNFDEIKENCDERVVLFVEALEKLCKAKRR